MVSSVLGYDAHVENKKKQGRRHWLNLLARFGRNADAPVWLRWRGTSFAALLRPTWGSPLVIRSDAKASPSSPSSSITHWQRARSKTLDTTGEMIDDLNIDRQDSTLRSPDLSSDQDMADIVHSHVGLTGPEAALAHYPRYRPFVLDDPAIDFDKGRTVINAEAYTAVRQRLCAVRAKTRPRDFVVQPFPLLLVSSRPKSYSSCASNSYLFHKAAFPVYSAEHCRLPNGKVMQE